jgi:HEPN domain-containing protein
VKKQTENWLKIAERDLNMAKLCIKGDEPLGVISHLHDAVEKLLKGLCSEVIGNPPKIHSLKRLAVEVCQVNLETKQIQLLNLLDEAYIDSRYPEDVERFHEEFDIENCQKLFIDIEGVFKCLKNLISKN